MRVSRFGWSVYWVRQVYGQTRFPFQAHDNIIRAQTRRVRQMVAHAYRSVPYYRETLAKLGLTPAAFQTATDLAKLPVLEREQLQRDPEYFVSQAQSLEQYLKLRSGGSSGAPRTVFHDTAALFQNAAHGERERSIFTALIGKFGGYRETTIASPLSTAQEVQEFCQHRSLLPRAVRIKRQYLSLLDPPHTNAAAMQDFQPDILHCYGSYLELLFPYLYAHIQSVHWPQIVTYSSDELSPAGRQFIEKTCGIPIFSTYQAIEAFKIGFECGQHHGLHLNSDLYPIRILDNAGREVPPGEGGEIIVSNLVNRATVLLNYRLGDRAHMLPGPCPCGRRLPLLSFLHGRSDDWLRLPSGQPLHSQAVRTIFTNETEIWQYQVVQEQEDCFRVAIVAAESANRRHIQERVTNKFMRLCGSEVRIEIEFVPEVGRTAGGKVRPVQSCLSAPTGGAYAVAEEETPQ